MDRQFGNQILKELMESEKTRLEAFIKRCEVLGDEEDLAQETFWKLHRYLPKIKDREHARRLLWKIARQKVVSFQRRTETRAWQSRTSLDAIDEGRYLGLDNDPVEAVANRELQKLLGEEVEQAPDRQVMELLSERLQGTRWKDVAKKLGESEYITRILLGKALALLVVWMADRGLDAMLLERWKQHGGRDAVRVLHRWARGQQPRQIARELKLPPAEVRRLRDAAVKFFAAQLDGSQARRT